MAPTYSPISQSLLDNGEKSLNIRGYREKALKAGDLLIPITKKLTTLPT
jgi:hypothetical protein